MRRKGMKLHVKAPARPVAPAQVKQSRSSMVSGDQNMRHWMVSVG